MAKGIFSKLNRKHQGGAALMISLVLIILLSIIAATALILTSNHYRLTQYLINSTQAFYFAETGIQRALYKIRLGDLSPNPENYSFEGAVINIDITDLGGNLYQVESSCTVRIPNALREIRATIQRGSETHIVSWEEF